MNSQLEMETELSGRIEVLDKLRTSLRETDREKKQLDTRYREQVSILILNSLECTHHSR